MINLLSSTLELQTFSTGRGRYSKGYQKQGNQGPGQGSCQNYVYGCRGNGAAFSNQNNNNNDEQNYHYHGTGPGASDNQHQVQEALSPFNQNNNS